MRVERTDWESERRTDLNLQDDWCERVQSRARCMAVASAVKLDAKTPAERNKEVVAEHCLQQTCTPAPPGPNPLRTEPSVQAVTSAIGRVERWERAASCLTFRGSARE